MSDASLSQRSKGTEISGVRLRPDLKAIKVSGRLRSYRVVVDEISGRFTRVSETVWQQLSGDGPIDPQVAMQARAAGMLRERRESPRRRFSLLAIRIPVGSIDGLANALAKTCGFLFAPFAILFWSAVILLTSIAVVSRWEMLWISLARLPDFLAQSSPMMIGIVFVVTKALHELAHAVMCRRMGSRCGAVGVMLLCGFPCPFCDVTDIWRQPSTTKRIAVMLAGIYIELVVASIAAIIWMVSLDPWVQLTALNVMLVCSVSTVLFNANPLMRYDGYYVLGDVVDSVNLKEDAQASFRSMVTRRLAGPRYEAPKAQGRRAVGFAFYHVFSRLYRVVIFCAIAMLIVRAGNWFAARNFAIALVTVAAVVMVVRFLRSAGSIASGKDRWRDVSTFRRWSIVFGVSLLVALLAFVPFPRYRSANGYVEATNAKTVYIPEDRLVSKVIADFGDVVQAEQNLVQLSGEDLRVKELELRGAFRLAVARSRLSRRSALESPNASRPEVDRQWDTLRASEKAAKAQLVSVQERLDKSNVKSPVSGVVIPAGGVGGDAESIFSLKDLERSSASAGAAWCTVCPDGHLQVSLVLDARDRKHIRLGSAVKVSLASRPDIVFETHITNVSAIVPADLKAVNRAAYRVICPLPDVDRDQLLTWVGQTCQGSIKTEGRSLAKELSVWLNDWFNG